MGLHVLIVDDSPTTRMMIERVVRLTDPEVAECHQASNGHEALEILHNHWVDMVFTDLHMKGLDGRELVQKIRANDLWKSLPIAVVTSERSDETEVELVELGANVYRQKPLTPESLRGLFHALRELIP